MGINALITQLSKTVTELQQLGYIGAASTFKKTKAKLIALRGKVTELELVVAGLEHQLAEAQAREHEALDMLDSMFTKYEDGVPCFDSPEDQAGFIGYTIHLSDDEFKNIADALNGRDAMPPEYMGRSALQSAIAAAVEPYKRDAARMNWLETKTVNVRNPMRYGSHDMFWASPGDEEDSVLPSDIRNKIDTILFAEKVAKGDNDVEND